MSLKTDHNEVFGMTHKNVRPIPIQLDVIASASQMRPAVDQFKHILIYCVTVDIIDGQPRPGRVIVVPLVKDIHCILNQRQP
ncbi:MAG TPA: hypothetical protein DGH68_03715 [Bacteroidetes bacterium]|nr:hypothetical protein [Bacteroidota bacterium]